MIGPPCFVLAVPASPFKSKLIVLRRRPHGRVRLTNHDRLFFIQLYRWFPAILKVLAIIRPETLARWHRAGFRSYWRWKSRPRGGRPADRHGALRAVCRDLASIRNAFEAAGVRFQFQGMIS